MGGCSQGIEFDVDLFKSVVSSTSVADFTGATCSIVCKNNAGGFTRVSALLVPNVCSRHNSPFRPDSIAENISKVAKADGVKDGAVGFSQVVVVLPKNVHSDFENALASGAAIARPFHLYTRAKNAMETPSTLKVCIAFYSQSSSSFFSDRIREIGHVAFGVRYSARLHDIPTNELHCSAFVAEAHEMVKRLKAEGHNVTIEVIEGKELEKRGFGGIYGVGKAAVFPPALVILNYNPPSATETVAWVGKGIVYDTGGLSIKSKTGMPGMKADMGGSAMVMCSFEAAVRCGVKYNLYGLLCLAENSVGPIATRPDDVHTLYSGKTVEINNTDAEGRLVLSDGVAYCSKHLNCDYIVDMATLTGAQGVATGQYFAAIVTTSEELENKAVSAGKRSGDLVHPLIYCPELLAQEFKSQVADFKNSVKSRTNAQVSCAAQFIANNLCGFEKTWMHIDFASPVNKGERGTGYGVALLLDLFVFNKV